MSYFGYEMNSSKFILKYDGERIQQLALFKEDQESLKYLANTVQVGRDFYGLKIINKG